METIDTVLTGIYRPPSSFSDPSRRCPVEHFQLCLQQMESFIEEHHPTNILVTGDFNFPMVDWESQEIKPGLNVLAADRLSAELLITMAEKFFLHQVVLEPTRNGTNILDLVFTNNEMLIHDVDVLKTEWSDHDIVSLTLKRQELVSTLQMKNEANSKMFIPDTPFDNLNFSKVSEETWLEINVAFHKVDWPKMISAANQDSAWAAFRDKVANICSLFVPKHTGKKRKRQSKIPLHRRKLLIKKRALTKKIKILKQSNSVDSKRIEELYTGLSRIEINMASDISLESRREETEVLRKIKINPKAFYSFAKRHKSLSSGIGPLKDADGVLQSDPATMADLLQQQYQQVFSEPADDFIILPPTADQPSLSTVNITSETVAQAIKEMAPNTAPGPDKFPALVLKRCCNSLAPVMSELWSASMKTGDIADIFKQQSIVPLFKKGNRSSPANYRPVSLTSQLVKVFERVVRRQMVAFVEANDLLTPDQHGFRGNRSCLSHLLHHIDDVLRDLEDGANADVLYLDYSKAFDKVNHTTLLRKLQHYGISGDLLRWIESFLVGRKQSVIVDGVPSQKGPVRSGVPQGTVLGPLLFVLYINDLPDRLLHTKCKMFADDTKLHRKICTNDDRDLLIKDLDEVISWANANSMELNNTKFQLLQHGKSTHLKKPYSLEGNIEVSNKCEVRDLGVMVDPGLTWKPHITETIKKAKTMASWVLRIFRTREQDHLLSLYKTYVRSQLEYCSPLWSPQGIGEIQRLEAVQRSFTARIEGIENLDYWERIKHLGIYSLQRRRERYKILYIWKMTNGLVPNPFGIEFRHSGKRGLVASRRLAKPSAPKYVKTLVHDSFSSTAVALFNIVPETVKEQPTLEMAKAKLDSILTKLPDKPPTKNYITLDNSLLALLGRGTVSSPLA